MSSVKQSTEVEVRGNANQHVRFLHTDVSAPTGDEIRVDVPCPRTAARPSSSLAAGRIPVKTMISPVSASQRPQTEHTRDSYPPKDAAALTILSSRTTIRFHCFPPTVGGSSLRCSAGKNSPSGSKGSVRPCECSGEARVPRSDASRMRSTTRRTCRVMGWLGGRTWSPYSATSSSCAAFASYGAGQRA